MTDVSLPWTYLSVPDDGVDARGRSRVEHALEEADADVGEENGGHRVHHRPGTHHGQEDEPEPEEYVDLLVEDVEGEDAEGVYLLDRPGSTVLVEGALGHSREDPDHGVHAVFLVDAAEAEHVRAVGQEGTAQERVDDEDVGYLRINVLDYRRRRETTSIGRKVDSQR